MCVRCWKTMKISWSILSLLFVNRLDARWFYRKRVPKYGVNKNLSLFSLSAIGGIKIYETCNSIYQLYKRWGNGSLTYDELFVFYVSYPSDVRSLLCRREFDGQNKLKSRRRDHSSIYFSIVFEPGSWIKCVVVNLQWLV